MGDAKRKAAAAVAAPSATKPFHITSREQLNLAIFLVSRKNSQADLRRNERVYEQFGLTDLVEQLVDTTPRNDGSQPGSVRPSDWAGKEPIRVDVTGDTVDHLRKVLDAEMEGPAGIILGRLLTRVQQREADTYQLPPELAEAQP
jgi:hypothetical protein